MYLVCNCYITLPYSIENPMGEKVITAQIKIIASVISAYYYHLNYLNATYSAKNLPWLHTLRSSGEMLSEAVEGMVKKYVSCLCDIAEWPLESLLTLKSAL